MDARKILDRLITDLSKGKVVVESLDIEDQMIDVTPDSSSFVTWAKTGRRTYTIVTKDGE